ncbi:MAG: S8 family serine peptidase [Acidobacteriia bacterium]|nr:S8 family serine peptidase [Terriglobia bacterium]
MIGRGLRCSVPILATILLALFVVTASISAKGQTAKDYGTDLQFHKFQPKIAPDQAVVADSAQSSIKGIGVTAAQQMQALQQDKATRTPAQRKIDSNIIYTMRMMAGQPAAPGVPYLSTGVDLDANDNIVVDMVANVTDQLLQQLTTAGAQVLYQNRELRSIRAIIPPSQMEGIASSPDVIFIWPKQGSLTARVQPIPPARRTFPRFALAPGFEIRAANIRRQLARLMLSTPGTAITWQGKVGTEGDLTHQTLDARGSFGIDGTGLKIGVLSDGVTSRALSQATGDLPPNCGTPPCLTVLAGQAGAGDEGTAMMEIIHDMVPGASLFFATADNSITSFAANIRALQAAGCQIIVDDVFYFVESPFQDGQTAGVVSTSQGGVVTQAVNDVVALGVFYFSSAGNEGGLDAGTSGTFEGDFVPQAAASPLPTGNVHNFGSGNGFDTITSPGEQVVGLFWADPLGGSGNDYDLYLLNSTGASILGASTNIQNGTQDPVELIGSANVINNNRLVVFQHTGAANRFFHLVLFRGRFAVATSGETHGHSAASGAYTVAATPAATSAGAPTPNGPFPNPFTSASQTEFFSSDGLRHIFFNADSTAITPGDFSATGGSILNKPDITAADGVSVTGVGGFGSPFFGTSAAAPSAASVAALVLSAQPMITAAQMRTALTSTAIDIMAPGFDRDAGNGIVMALPAIQSLGVAGTANPALAVITGNENPGNGNGVIERGEGGILSIQLKNTGGVRAATAVTATLTSSTPGVIITRPGASTYADMAIGAVGSFNLSPLTFTLDSTYPCGQTANFTLTVNYTGGTRVLNFTLPTGLLSITNTLGTTPPSLLGVTTATGTQTNRINRNGVISACGTPKAFPGAITGSHTFDSYTFTACQAFCMTPQLNGGAAGVNLFTAAYTPAYNPASIGTNYAGDAGLSTNIQSFGISTTAATQYTIAVSDVAGNPLPPPAPPNTYTIQIPTCALNCNVNQLPVAQAQNVTVLAGTGGTANANVDNGSFDPDGGPITLSQIPPGPYPAGANNVILTVVDSQGATAQADATVTVGSFGLTLSAPSIVIQRGQSATQTIQFTSSMASPGLVTFSCSGNLPPGSTCTLSPPTLPAGSTSGTVILVIDTATSLALKRRQVFYAAWMPFAGMGLIGMIVMAAPKKRRRISVLLMTFVMLATLVSLGGCGSSHTTFGPTNVTVSAITGGATQTATFSLTVRD